MIVLDTNVVSELMKPVPSDAVVHWVSSRSTSGLYTTAITRAEVLHGILLLPRGRRRSAFEAAAAAMFDQDFNDRVLPFGNDAADLYAVIVASRTASGRPISQFDAQIAAIARSNGASLATRNVKDFIDCGVDIIDPWA